MRILLTWLNQRHKLFQHLSFHIGLGLKLELGNQPDLRQKILAQRTDGAVL